MAEVLYVRAIHMLYTTSLRLYYTDYDRSVHTAADDFDMAYELSTNYLYRSVNQLSNLADPI